MISQYEQVKTVCGIICTEGEILLLPRFFWRMETVSAKFYVQEGKRTRKCWRISSVSSLFPSPPKISSSPAVTMIRKVQTIPVPQILKFIW